MDEITPSTVERVDGAIRMFRVWRVTEGNLLKAWASDHVWQPGVNTSHMIPRLGGSQAGFYGFNFFNQMGLQERFGHKDATNVIGGSIICFGKFVVASQGGRTEKAIVESIVEPPDMPFDYVTTLFAVAENYGCHVLSAERAEKLRTGVIPYVQGMKL